MKSITVRLKCEDCGHEQEVTSCGDHVDAAGNVHRYFGSAYDFCDKCDGLVKVIDADSTHRVA